MHTSPGLAGRLSLTALLLGLWLSEGFASPAQAGAPALRDAQGMLLVDGQPRLILGMYENPANDADLEDAVRSGFNLFQCPPERAALDRLHRLGAKAWVNLGGALDLSTDTAQRTAQLSKTIESVGNHPALLVWEGPDEILWNQWWVPLETVRAELRTMRGLASARADLAELATRAQGCLERGLYTGFQKAREEFWRKAGQPCPNPDARVDEAPDRVRTVGNGITAGLRHVKRLDPNHVVWLNHAPRNSLENLRLFNQEADMAGCDIYPAPANLEVGHSDLTDMSLSSVGAYTRRMREAAPGRACAMVLQGFGWRDLRETVTDHQTAVGIGRRPTFAESRFMAYDAILNGANAVLYWGTAYQKPSEQDGAPGTGRPRLWRDLLKVGRELRALEPALVAKPSRPPAVRMPETFGSHDRPAILASLRQVGDDFVLLVANESAHGLAFAVERLPRRLEGRTLHRLHGGEEHRVTDGRLMDGIKGTDVHVYATSRRFEPAGP